MLYLSPNKIPPFCFLCVWGLTFYHALVLCWLSGAQQGPHGLAVGSGCVGLLLGVLSTQASALAFVSPHRASCSPSTPARPLTCAQPHSSQKPLAPSVSAASPPLYPDYVALKRPPCACQLSCVHPLCSHRSPAQRLRPCPAPLSLSLPPSYLVIKQTDCCY